jgi:hypothetical protein
MDVFGDVGKEILRWKIEVVKVIMICESMSPVATVLLGYMFVTLFGRWVCLYYMYLLEQF